MRWRPLFRGDEARRVHRTVDRLLAGLRARDAAEVPNRTYCSHYGAVEATTRTGTSDTLAFRFRRKR